MDMTNILAATFIMTLKQFDNQKLAALNNAVQSWGKLQPGNLAFDDAVELELVQRTGEPFDLEALQRASAYEVNRRVAEGVFYV